MILYLTTNTKQMLVDCYVDEYFVGLNWNKYFQYPVCKISRTLFVVTFDNCSVLWVSMLNAEIELSALNSEYVVLSYAVIKLVRLESLIN